MQIIGDGINHWSPLINPNVGESSEMMMQMLLVFGTLLLEMLSDVRLEKLGVSWIIVSSFSMCKSMHCSEMPLIKMEELSLTSWQNYPWIDDEIDNSSTLFAPCFPPSVYGHRVLKHWKFEVYSFVKSKGI